MRHGEVAVRDVDHGDARDGSDADIDEAVGDKKNSPVPLLRGSVAEHEQTRRDENARNDE